MYLHIGHIHSCFKAHSLLRADRCEQLGFRSESYLREGSTIAQYAV